jgi:hypothetical protein
MPARPQYYSLSVLLLLCLEQAIMWVGFALCALPNSWYVSDVLQRRAWFAGVIGPLFLLHLGVLFHYLYLQWSGGTRLVGCAGVVLMAIGWVVVVACQDNNGLGWSFHGGGVVILLAGSLLTYGALARVAWAHGGFRGWQRFWGGVFLVAFASDLAFVTPHSDSIAARCSAGSALVWRAGAFARASRSTSSRISSRGAVTC